MNETLNIWQSFYQLTGGAAAGLMGLVFAAASLAARLLLGTNVKNSDIRTFVNPIIIHFSTVLLIAMFAVIPTQTHVSLGVLLVCVGAAGIAFECRTVLQLWQHHHQSTPVNRADWMWRMSLPAAGYMLIFAAAIGLLLSAFQSLNLLAVAVIMFLLLGIRNAWDLILWIAKQQLPV